MNILFLNKKYSEIVALATPELLWSNIDPQERVYIGLACVELGMFKAGLREMALAVELSPFECRKPLLKELGTFLHGKSYTAHAKECYDQAASLDREAQDSGECFSPFKRDLHPQNLYVDYTFFFLTIGLKRVSQRLKTLRS